MFRRKQYHIICITFGISVILLLMAGILFTINLNNYYLSCSENLKIHRKFLSDASKEEKIFGYNVHKNTYDGSSAVDEILEATRIKIKEELKSYNFKNASVLQLEELLMESGGQPVRNLIISTWRSGSTFLGDILNELPGTFYYYEPLLMEGMTQTRGPPNENKALSIIDKMFKCNFYDMDNYFEYSKEYLDLYSRNKRLWENCKRKKDLCLDPKFNSDFCKLFPFQTMKLVRVKLRVIQKILENNNMNVNVLLLVRDPRGVMQSRQHRNFCKKSQDCWLPELLCADMISDYVAAARLMKKFPNKIMVQRFEELALDPNTTTHRIFGFFGLNVVPAVEEFIRSHTNVNVDVRDAISTYRVSSTVPFKWKDLLDFDSVNEIQVMCKQALSLWGYKMANNATHMRSKDFYPLDSYTVTL